MYQYVNSVFWDETQLTICWPLETIDRWIRGHCRDSKRGVHGQWDSFSFMAHNSMYSWGFMETRRVMLVDEVVTLRNKPFSISKYRDCGRPTSFYTTRSPNRKIKYTVNHTFIRNELLTLSSGAAWARMWQTTMSKVDALHSRQTSRVVTDEWHSCLNRVIKWIRMGWGSSTFTDVTVEA